MRASPMERLLEMAGLKENPFAFHEAGKENDLAKYFVAPAGFDEILGDPQYPASSLVHAPKGGGKTAVRREIHRICSENGFAGGDVLAVRYSDFESLFHLNGRGTPPVILRGHVLAILKRVMRVLAEDLAGRERRRECFKKLSKWDSIHVRWFLFHAFHHCLGEDRIEELSQNGISPFTKGEIARLIGRPSGASPHVAALLRRLADKLESSSSALFSHLSELLHALDYEALYVLIDCLDEGAVAPDNEEAGIRLVSPLLTNLRLLTLKRVAFKFFMPTRWVELMLGRDMIRDDKIVTARIEWTDQDMLDILRKRLAAFGNSDGLGEMCEADLAGVIEKHMVAGAEQNPRNLIRLGQYLLLSHCQILNRQRNGFRRIGAAAWEKAVKRLKNGGNGLDKSDPIPGPGYHDPFFPDIE